MPRTTRQEFQHQFDQAKVNLQHYQSHVAKCLQMMLELRQQSERGEVEWNDSYERQGDEYSALLEVANNLMEMHNFVRKDF